MEVSNTGANPIGMPISVTNSTFSTNGRSGLQVNVSSPTALTLANSLNVFSTTFTSNLRGITIGATLGNVTAAFQNNTITGSADTGMYVNGTANSSLNFNGNVVTNNKAATLFGGQGVGGILFTGTPPTAMGKFNFVSNQIHHNALNQVVAFSNSFTAVTWPLNGTTSASCDPATANVFSCYNSSPAPSTSVGVVAIGAGCIVQANGNSWQNAAPASGTDYSTSGGAVFTPNPPSPVCPASTIACP